MENGMQNGLDSFWQLCPIRWLDQKYLGILERVELGGPDSKTKGVQQKNRYKLLTAFGPCLPEALACNTIEYYYV